MIFENRMNVNDDKDEIHQTESVINLNGMIYRMNYLMGCTNRHPSRRHPEIVQCPTWQDASIDIRHDGVYHLSDTTCRGAPNSIDHDGRPNC